MNILNEMRMDLELRGMANSTQEAYLRRVQSFLDFIDKDVAELEMNDFRSFIIFLKDEKKLSFGTINAYISPLKFFYTITLEKEWNIKMVPRMKGYKSFPIVLSKEEVLEIIDSVDNIKHKAILMLMYGSGLRVSEVAKLKVDDIDSKNFQIHIRQSKNRSDRYAILSQKCLEILRIYWLECGKPRDWLFVGNKQEEHIHPKTIKNLMIKLRNKLNIKKNISAHTLRHCFATHLLESNVQLPYIQQMMGHKSIKTTTRYLHMTSKAMMNIKSPLDEAVE